MPYCKLVEITEELMAESRRLINLQDRYSQPFRDRFSHTMRVLNWAKRINVEEKGDINILTAAILFHDAGWSDTQDHALVGAELAENYLLHMNIDPVIVNRITSAIQTHNKRSDTDGQLPIENLIVMDADILDEVGVTTLVWDALAAALEDAPNYVKVLEKDLGYFKKAQEHKALLRTAAGKRFYDERISIWEKCISHFQYELGLSDTF